MSCPHHSVNTTVKYFALTEREGGPIIGQRAKFTLNCKLCGAPFTFRLDRASLSQDGREIRVDVTVDRAEAS